MKQDYYSILQIDKNASINDIKKAYRKMALKYHPDKYDGNGTMIKEINEAYSVLSDSNKKSEYDKNGHLTNEDINEEFDRQIRKFHEQFMKRFADIDDFMSFIDNTEQHPDNKISKQKRNDNKIQIHQKYPSSYSYKSTTSSVVYKNGVKQGIKEETYTTMSKDGKPYTKTIRTTYLPDNKKKVENIIS